MICRRAGRHIHCVQLAAAAAGIKQVDRRQVDNSHANDRASPADGPDDDTATGRELSDELLTFHFDSHRRDRREWRNSVILSVVVDVRQALMLVIDGD